MSKVEKALQDPDAVALYGEILSGLSLAEVVEIWRAVQDAKLREWAWHQRNLDMVRPGKRPEPRTPIPGFVYLCRNNRNGLIKIGFSRQPNYREATLQAEDPDITFIHIIPGTRGYERALHQVFADKRRRGEWFSLTPQEIESAVVFFPVPA